ncbi:MAG: ABC transporter permease [Planctomycetes bacterium]|nr:ABC transporter permease [Planctomycetota bacterium]
MAYMRKVFAFVLRDIINETSYKFSFFTQLAGIIVSTTIFFFLSKLLGNAGVSYLKPYKGNYFSFILIGIAFFNYLRVATEGLSKSIREGQMLGTLEAMLVTQTGISTIIISSSLYGFIFTSFKVAVYLLLGILVYGVDIGNANVVGAVIILLLTIISFNSLGIISASFVMVLKKGDPISWMITNVSGIVGGVYYPVSVLPLWLQKLSYLLPITYSMEGMRLSLLNGYSLKLLLPNIIGLTLFSLIMTPLSIAVFGYAVGKAKQDGTLTHY